MMKEGALIFPTVLLLAINDPVIFILSYLYALKLSLLSIQI
jgi:hypothetical protein